MADINLLKDLFLCPISYDEDACDADGKPLPLSCEDNEIHFSLNAADMLKSGSKIFLIEKLPEKLKPAKVAHQGIHHLRKIDSPDGRSFIPLFISYSSLVNIFGDKVRIGIVSFKDAKDLCINENNIAGIVVAPLNINKTIPRESLVNM